MCERQQHQSATTLTVQHSATQRKTAQNSATQCSTVQHSATQCNIVQHTQTHSITLHHAASPCITLQHPATYCNTLQHKMHIMSCIATNHQGIAPLQSKPSLHIESYTLVAHEKVAASHTCSWLIKLHFSFPSANPRCTSSRTPIHVACSSEAEHSLIYKALLQKRPIILRSLLIVAIS